MGASVIAEQIAGLDEPVRRYFTHAIAPEAPLARGLSLTMTGKVKADLWLTFRAVQEVDGQSFSWQARVGLGRLTLASLAESYAHGVGSSEGLLFGRRSLFATADEDTARSAAGRAALESAVFAPVSVLPERGVAWRAEGEDAIVGRFNLPPERPEVELQIDSEGAVTEASAQRWGPLDDKRFGYIPCGYRVHAKRRFGGLTIPSSVTVSWHFGRPEEAPFLRAEVTDARLIA